MGVVAAVGLAACGGSAKPAVSALNPATKVPSTAVAFASIAVRPQGQTNTDLVSLVNKLGGTGSAKRLSRKLLTSLSNGSGAKGGATKFKQAEAWLGQRIGFALVALPQTPTNLEQIKASLVLIAPTSDPTAAMAFLKQQPSLHAEAWRVQGHYVLIGGAKGVAAAAATKPAHSLAQSSAYTSALQQVASGRLATVFVRLRPLSQLVMPLLSQAGDSQVAFTPAADTAASVPAGSTLTVALGVGAKNLHLDVVRAGVSDRSQPPQAKSGAQPASVSGLPNGSWLALALGGALATPNAAAALSQILKHFDGIGASAGSSTPYAPDAPQPLAPTPGPGLAGPGLSGPAGGAGLPNQFMQDLLSALGPIDLSVAGTSLADLQAGLTLDSVNHAAGSRFAQALKRKLAGLPVKVTGNGGRVVVSHGFASLRALLSPKSTLASNAGYKQAAQQLPSGSDVPLYLRFGPLVKFGSVLDGANTKLWHTLGKLNYLIAGGTGRDFRVVLATN